MTKMNNFNLPKTLMKNVLPAMGAFALLSGTGVVVTMVNTPAAHAQIKSAKSIVDDALSKGVIGETISGYLAPVDGGVVSVDVRNAMNEINIGRKSVYTRLAREQNLSIEVVATLTGEKQIAKARSGHKVLDQSGQWRTK
ncbi:MAG: YdbL family protein [Maricaulaceae bacterium]